MSTSGNSPENSYMKDNVNNVLEMEKHHSAICPILAPFLLCFVKTGTKKTMKTTNDIDINEVQIRRNQYSKAGHWGTFTRAMWD